MGLFQFFSYKSYLRDFERQIYLFTETVNVQVAFVSFLSILSSQVCSVLELLEREFRVDEDLYSSARIHGEDPSKYVENRLYRHLEQRKGVLKVSDSEVVFYGN